MISSTNKTMLVIIISHTELFAVCVCVCGGVHFKMAASGEETVISVLD